MTSAAHMNNARKPTRVAVLPPSAFADDWADRPEADVAIGLRFVSVEDVEIARNTAVRRAREWLAPKGQLLDERAFNEAYNDEVITVIVARATTDPNDVGRTYFAVAEETIRRALNMQGVARLWDELQLMHLCSGVAMPRADDDDVALLTAILSRGVALAQAPEGVAIEARKLVSYLLEQLRKHDPEAEADPDDEEDGVPVYVARAAG